MIETRQIVNWDQAKVQLLQCLECNQLPLQPHQCYECQRLLCQGCLGEWKLKSRGPKLYCTNCKSLQYFNPANNNIFQGYRDLIISCPNKRFGCKVTSDFKKYQKHLEECDYIRVPCASPGCFVTTLKRYRPEHLSICEYVIENCTQCTKPFNRKTMSYHLEKCNVNPQEIVPEENQVSILRGELLKVRNQLDQAINQYDFTAELTQLTQRILAQREEIQRLKNKNN